MHTIGTGSPPSRSVLETPMAKRGMLPKFRPAQLGRDATARPTIRPVKASPPPPPPSPPRKMSSGFSPKSSVAVAEPLAPLDSDGDHATAIAPYREPPTLDRSKDSAYVGNALRDEDLPSTTAVPRGRVDAMLVSFDDDDEPAEDETQARRPEDHRLPSDHFASDSAEPETATLTPSTAPSADMGIAYDSLPSLEVRRPFDTYEAEFAERDPVTAMRAQHESAHVRRAEPQTSSAAPTPVVKLPSFRESFSSIGADSAQYDKRAFNDPDFNARARRIAAYDDGAYIPPPREHVEANDYEASVETDAPVGQGDRGWGRREESGPRAVPRNDFEPAHSSPPWNGRDLPYDMHDAGAPQHDALGPIPHTGFSTMPPSPEMAPLAHDHDSLPPVEQPYIPPAPRVPAEARGNAGFVMGVQPIRNNANHTDAWPPAPAFTPAPMQPYGNLPSPMQAMQSSMPPQGYAQPQPQAYVNASPRAEQRLHATPMPGSLSPHVMPHAPHAHASQRNQMPAPAALAAPPPQNKIGRFAWFVAGVAFGITFAIFATGFFGTGSIGGSKAAASEPPAATTAVSPAHAAPPPVLAAATTPASAAPVAAPPPVGTVASTTPSSLPAAGGALAPATAAANKPAPIAKAAPVVRRPSAPVTQRRPFSAPSTSDARPVRSGGDDEGGGGGGAKAAAPPPEAGDLLGAALR